MIQDIPTAAWTALVGAIGLILGFVAKWGPDRTSAASQLTTASVAFINELQEQNALLRDEIRTLKGENRKLRTEVRDLRVQVDRLQSSIDRMTDTD